MLILHPDYLLSATVVADSFNCIRLAALKDRVKAINEMSISSVYGNILHEILQIALLANDFSTKFLFSEIDRLVIKEMQNLFSLRLEVRTAVEHLRTKVPFLQDWAERFVLFKPRPDSVAKGHRTSDALLSINKVLDVEEHIWSPKYGLKGNIDVTAQAKIIDEHGQRTLTVPFEVKTGRNTKIFSHRAQTMLYTLLMSDRYGMLHFDPKLHTANTSQISIRYVDSSTMLRHLRSSKSWH